MVVLDTDGVLDLDDLPPELMEDGDQKLAVSDSHEKPILPASAQCERSRIIVARPHDGRD